MSEINLPKFDEFLAPILKYANDGKEHTLSETIEAMSNQFNLSEEDRNLLMPNGKRTYIYDRIAWAITYLVQAGLLVRTGRSKYKISDRGKAEVKIIPEKISYRYLEKFESFRKFKESQHPKKDLTGHEILYNGELTPDEEIEEIFNKRQDILAHDLLNYLTTIKPSDFERVVIDTLLLLGYGRNFKELAKKLGQPNDQGIDGEIPLDKLGLEKIYIQAKRYSTEHPVTSSDIRDFIGALTTRSPNARKGVFITTSKFTREAKEIAKKDTNHSIILIDGLELAKLMIEYNVGVREIKEYTLKELDKDYFESL